VHQAEKTYRNKDTFLDLPLLTRISDFNKWKYANENEDGWFSQTGIRLKGKQCIGGQIFLMLLTTRVAHRYLDRRCHLLSRSFGQSLVIASMPITPL
jgi:hypothetical protein